jgi:hypothetical protein
MEEETVRPSGQEALELSFNPRYINQAAMVFLGIIIDSIKITLVHIKTPLVTKTC